MAALFVWKKEYSFAELLYRLQGSFIFLDKIVCSDMLKLYKTIQRQEVCMALTYFLHISLHSVLLKNKRGGYYDK